MQQYHAPLSLFLPMILLLSYVMYVLLTEACMKPLLGNNSGIILTIIVTKALY